MNTPAAAFNTVSATQDDSLPREVDVAIIGGGLMGCACAYYLSKAGAKVLLIDKSPHRLNNDRFAFERNLRQLLHKTRALRSL